MRFVQLVGSLALGLLGGCFASELAPDSRAGGAGPPELAHLVLKRVP